MIKEWYLIINNATRSMVILFSLITYKFGGIVEFTNCCKL
ncbi:unnamed protein product, partial [Vitis vinifera]|uniref:Uncharacterized protein n=1 Tax=Vitis vinifera TaxID=29760 RepID=D7U8N9_VITVI